MTRKDYIAIADAIKASERPETRETKASIREIALRLCDIFANDNPAFDRDKFLSACGVQS